MINNKPNIFEYATKELSQDAVFMYLFDCYNSKNAVDFEIGKDFLKLIYSTQNIALVKPIKRITIKKQYHSIDVLVLVEFEDRTVDVFIIEDKTFSTEHDNQLKRYYDDINDNGVYCYENSAIKPDNIFGVYFKLGELNINEKKALTINDRFSYKYLDYNSFKQFLYLHKQSNCLLQLIYDFYEERLKEIEKVDNADFTKPVNLVFDEVLSSSYAQDKYMRWLMKKIVKSEYYEGNQYSVMNYGKPCTQYRFVFTEEDKNSDWDCKTYGNISKYCYFFRLDSNSKGWYLAINQYDEHGDKNWAEKSQVRDSIRECVNVIIKKNGVHDNTDNRGKKESKICLFNINSFDDVLVLIPTLQEVYSTVLKLTVD